MSAPSFSIVELSLINMSHQMTAQHRATISILDMCLRFSDALLAWHGDEVTHDISRQSFVRKTRKQRRTRRARQLHQKDVDVIGFGAVPTVAALSSDESSSDEDEEAESLAAANDSNWRNETFASLSLADEPFASRIEIMTSELDVLVRFLRRSVENMGNGGEEGSATFSILAFMLDNWDNY
jgi:gamma-tubulin complex component 5